MLQLHTTIGFVLRWVFKALEQRKGHSRWSVISRPTSRLGPRDPLRQTYLRYPVKFRVSNASLTVSKICHLISLYLDVRLLNSFLELNLEKHEYIGIHKFRSKKQTLLDYSIDLFNRKVETVETAKEGRAMDSFVDLNVPDNNDFPMGWALKKKSSDTITDLAYDTAAEYFMAQRTMNPPRRAEPRAYSLMMEEMVKPDGDYMFKASELLSEKQLTGLFSRMETKRTSGVSIARKKRGRQTTKSSRKRRRPASSEEEKEEGEQEEEVDQEVEELEVEIDEEDFVRDCIKENYNDIFL